MDVTDNASIAKAFDAAEAALGPVSVLINNAGIAVEKMAIDQTEADWDAVIGANLKGAYFAATEAARRMIAHKVEGNIVNIASVLGFGADQGGVALCDLQGRHRAGDQGTGAGTRRAPHSRQCAGARLYRYRHEPRRVGHARGREAWSSASRSAGSVMRAISTVPSCCWPRRRRGT